MNTTITLQEAMLRMPEAVKAYVNELSLSSCVLPLTTPGDVLQELFSGRHVFFETCEGVFVSSCGKTMAWCDDSFEWFSVTDVSHSEVYK